MITNGAPSHTPMLAMSVLDGRGSVSGCVWKIADLVAGVLELERQPRVGKLSEKRYGLSARLTQR